MNVFMLCAGLSVLAYAWTGLPVLPLCAVINALFAIVAAIKERRS